MLKLILHVETTEKLAPEAMDERLTEALARLPELGKPTIVHPGPARSAAFDAVAGTAAVLTVTLPTIQLLAKNIEMVGVAVDAVLVVIPKLRSLFRELGLGARVEVGMSRVALEAAERPEAEKIVAWQARIEAARRRSAGADGPSPPPGDVAPDRKDGAR